MKLIVLLQPRFNLSDLPCKIWPNSQVTHMPAPVASTTLISSRSCLLTVALLRRRLRWPFTSRLFYHALPPAKRKRDRVWVRSVGVDATAGALTSSTISAPGSACSKWRTRDPESCVKRRRATEVGCGRGGCKGESRDG